MAGTETATVTEGAPSEGEGTSGEAGAVEADTKSLTIIRKFIYCGIISL